MKSIKQFILVMSFTALLLGVNLHLASADASTTGFFPLAPVSSYGSLPAPTTGSATGQFTQVVYDVIMKVRYVLGAICIAMLVFSGFRMVTGQGNEEVYASQRKAIMFSIIGLAVVGLAGEVPRILSVGCENSYTPVGQTGLPCDPSNPKTFLNDPNSLIRTATLFSQRTQLVITFIKYIIGSVAVLLIIRNTLRMVAMGSEEDKLETDKKNLVYTIIGLVMIVVSDNIISKVFYKLDLTRYPTTDGVRPAIDVNQGLQTLAGFTNFTVTLLGPIAVLALVAGGLMYAASAGNEERMGQAKRIVTMAIIGIILIYGAFAIVSTIIAGQLPQS